MLTACLGEGLITILLVVCWESILSVRCLVRRLVRRTGFVTNDSVLFLREDNCEDAPKSESISSMP